MFPSDGKVLALGNTASVMPTIAASIENLFVAYPAQMTSVVLQNNRKSFPSQHLNYPFSASCYEFVKRMSRHFDFFHSELLFAPACNAAGVNYGVHIHGVTDVELLFPAGRFGRVLKRSYRDALANANYVVCHSAATSAVKELRKDATTLPLPVDTRQFNDSVKPVRFGSAFAIFSPGRMDPWKGHETIWGALRLMRTRNDVTVYQSDWGWEPSYSYCKKHAPENVKFIPLIPREQIASYYRGADLVLGQMKSGLKRRIADFNMIELEAAACGAPVLINLLDKSTPFLPKEDGAQALAELMDSMVENDDYRADYAKSCMSYVVPAMGSETVSREFSEIVAACQVGSRRTGGGLMGLVPGSALELAGRLLGQRRFQKVKSRLIGL